MKGYELRAPEAPERPTSPRKSNLSPMSDEKVIVSVNEAMYAQGPAGGKDGPGAPPPYTETVKPYVASTMIVGQSVDVDRKPRGCFGAFVWLMATWPIVLAILIPVIAILIIATVRFPEYPAFIEGNRARNNLGARQFDAYEASRDDWKKQTSKLGKAIDVEVDDKQVDPFSQEVFRQSINLWFESESGDIFSPANVASMERVTRQADALLGDFCVRREKVCAPHASIFTLPAVGMYDSRKVKDALMAATDIQKDTWRQYVGASTDYQTGLGKWARARLRVGGPITGYRNLEDRSGEQADAYEANFKFPGFTGTATKDGWITKIVELIDKESKVNKDLKVRFASFPMIGPIMFGALIADALLAIGALLAVGFIMWVQVGSVLLSICGMLQIVVSFAITMSTWKIIGNTSFTFIQVLVIFIILGIGADDVFVFMDAWKQSRNEHRCVSGNLISRLSWTWTRSFTAMLVTTATTIGALVLTSLIDVPSIATFGTFAAIVVAWNFLFCVTWFPCMVMLHEKYIVNKNNGCCAKRVCGCCCEKCGDHWGMNDKTENRHGKLEDLRGMERFFKYTLHAFLSKPMHRYIVFLVFTILAVIGVALAASQVALTDKSLTESFLKEESDIQQMFNLILGSSDAFQATSSGRKRAGHIVYGIDREDPIDRSGTYALGEGDQIGEPRFTKVDLASEKFQNHVIETCDKIKKLDSTAVNVMTKEKEVICFMRDFKAYKEGKGETFPVAPASLVSQLIAWRKDQCTTVGCYSNRKGTGLANVDKNYDDNTGFLLSDDQTTIKMVFVSGNLTIPYIEQELKLIEPEYEEWKKLGVEQSKDGFGPYGMTDRSDWIMLMQTLINGVITGVPVALAVAFGVLLLATANVWVSLIATFTIVGVMASFFITFTGTKGQLGFYECMFLQITVGMSVDYVVHLAHSYNMSKKESREDKMQDSLGEMGISVFSGALTTLAASGLLFACQFNIFFQYGSFIFFVILWSIIWALLVFPALMMQFGPCGRSGDVAPIRWVHMQMCSGLEEMSGEGQEVVQGMSLEPPKTTNGTHDQLVFSSPTNPHGEDSTGSPQHHK